MAADDVAAALLGELRAGGEVDSQGRFTLDRAQARAKMQKFQLVDARRYVLELVQAAVLRGATNIAFEIDADDMRMRFDGATFTAAELDDLWGSIFADGDGALIKGVRQLALGLNAALGLGPKHIVVRSGDHELRLVPGQAEVMREIAAVVDTEVHVKQRLGLATVGGFLRNLAGRLAEEVHLLAHCMYSTVPITLDGASISRGMHVEGAVVEHAIEGSATGVVAVTEATGWAKLRLVMHGVWIDTRTLETCGPGIVAVVTSDRLRRDVSLAKIVDDDEVTRIDGLVDVERWGAMAELAALADQPAQVVKRRWQRVKTEVVQHMAPRDLAKRPMARRAADAARWIDARTRGVAGTVSLLELEKAVSLGTLKYAANVYPLLERDAVPVPHVTEKEDLKGLGRILKCKLVAIDDELARASRRAQARAGFLTRTVPAGLLTHRDYAVRGPLTAGTWLRGTVGIGASAVRPEPAEVDTLWLLREGCMLAMLELDWGIPGVNAAVEAMFEPTDDHNDAVRDRVVVDAVLQVLAAVGPMIAGLATNDEAAPRVHTMMRAWLSMVFEVDARARLWDRLGVPAQVRPGPADVARVLPTSEQLLADGSVYAAMMAAPLLTDFDGARRSLDDVAWRWMKKRQIDVLDRLSPRMAGIGEEVLWLDAGELAIVKGMFGEHALCSWLPTLDMHMRAGLFLARPRRTIAERAAPLREALEQAGLDPARWSTSVDEAGVRAVLAFNYGAMVPTTAEGLRAGAVELMHDGRSLTTRVLDLGVGPIVGVASFVGLRPTATWDDVEDDAALATVVATLRGAAWTLLASAVDAGVDPQRWLVQVVMRRLALEDRDAVEQWAPTVMHAPLLATLDGGAMSLADVEAARRGRRKIAWVPVGTPAQDLGAAGPVLCEGPAVVAALQALFGEGALVSGEAQLELRRREARLAARPTIAAAVLDAATVWSAQSLGDTGMGKVSGEVGLSRVADDEGLTIALCTGGRLIDTLHEAESMVALRAIVADEALPLTADGSVDRRSKRYGQILKRCRRMLPGLIVGLCGRFAALEGDERAQARRLLLAYAAKEAWSNQERASNRQQALDAVRAVALVRDVWGREHTLAEVAAHAQHSGQIELVRGTVTAPPELAGLGRMILRADPESDVGLAKFGTLVFLDAKWDAELAAMRAMLSAPRFELPEVSAVSWIDRKATIAGGLEVHLWISRTPRDDDAVMITRGERVVGKLVVVPGIACAGVICGEGIGPELDARQQASLAKQVCLLVEALAGQIKANGGRVKKDERERARTWLVRVDLAIAELDAGLQERLGKPLVSLRAALAGLVSPTLRRARDKSRELAVVKEVVVPAVVVPPVARVVTPEEALIGAVKAELEWARARHGGLLQRLRLDRLAIGTGPEPGIVVFDEVLALQQRHPLVGRPLARLAAGEPLDPVDLMFVVSAVYTVMNAVAEQIDADDEQAFVARMAQSLALALA